MVKLLVFAILLASSPATGLIETLFRVENICYSGCSSNYGDSSANLDACRKGCDYKLLNKNKCAEECNKHYQAQDARLSCEMGCSLSNPVDINPIGKPVIAVDPIPGDKIEETTPVSVEPERPRSIILIRLRQRPSGDFPQMPHMFNGDPIQMFSEMIKRFQERANAIEQSIRTSFEENSKDFPKLPGFEPIQESANGIPIIHIPLRINADSSSSEDSRERHPMMKEFLHKFDHHREHMQPAQNRFRQFITDVRTEWNDLIRKQPKIPIWIFLAIFISSSAILWYMVMSLCRHTPSREALSIRAQELVFHPYDYEAYEKEKIQPDDQPYEVTESLPIKVKLSNI